MRFHSLVLLILFVPGCWTAYRDDLDYSYAVEQKWTIDELNFGEISQFESVQWNPDDSANLRKMIVEDSIASGRDVLEIGTGTGLISILCLQNDADNVVATDANPAAIACARYNAAMLVPDSKIDVRLLETLSSNPFSVIEPDEKFDLILSRDEIAENFLADCQLHLNPGGRCLFACKNVAVIRRMQSDVEEAGFTMKLLDDRMLDSLADDFLPAILIEIKPPLK